MNKTMTKKIAREPEGSTWHKTANVERPQGGHVETVLHLGAFPSVGSRAAGTNAAVGRTPGSSDVGPIDVIPKAFARNGSVAFALQVYAQRLAKRLPFRDRLAEIANRCARTLGIVHLIQGRQPVQVSMKFFHADTLPNGNAVVNTVWSFT